MIKNRFIAYSLGNFCTYARFNLKGANGVAPILKVFCGPDGSFKKAHVISIKQAQLGIPVVDNQHQAFNLIKELTEQDFPNNNLVFHNSGIITNIQNQ